MEANAKSVLALISADIQPGDPDAAAGERPGRRGGVRGADAVFAGRFCRLRRAAARGGPGAARASPLPRSLQAAAPAQILRGTVLCAGLAEGVIKRAEGLRFSEECNRSWRRGKRRSGIGRVRAT